MKYRSIALYRVFGIVVPKDDNINLLSDADRAFRAVLTRRPDEMCFESDRAFAVGFLLLTGGIDQPERLKAELSSILETRRARFGDGPYLVIETNGEVKEFTSQNIVETDDFIIHLDVPQNESIRVAVARQEAAVLLALALETGRVSCFDRVCHRIVYFRNDGRPVYAYSLSGSGAGLFVSRVLTDSEVQGAKDWRAKLLANPPLERVVRLLVSSMETEQDALHSFLFCWTALEIFIKKVSPYYKKSPLSANLAFIFSEFCGGGKSPAVVLGGQSEQLDEPAL
jgi:hypothetical protein